jgi:type II secretory pathway pseudopilin PulG
LPAPPEIKLLPNFILPCGKNPKKRNTPNTMKLNTRNVTKKSGMTLLELTVVILVLLSLISILFIGARAWKRGSDRAGCIMNIRNVQQAVRGQQNMQNLAIGASLPTTKIWKQNVTSTDSSGNAVTTEVDTGFLNEPTCPSNGTYTPTGTVPAYGTLYMTCSLAGTLDHAPTVTSDW